MTDLPVESFIIQRLQEGGWRVIHRRADLTDLPIADFVSHRDAEEWVNWKSGHPKINPYAMADEAGTPPRLVEIAIEPRSKADEGELGIALAKLAAEDPTFGVSIDHESGQTILKGVSKGHLDAKLDILKWTYKIDARAGAPEDCTGSVIGDLSLRRGQIRGQDMRGKANVIRAMAPLMNMFGYAETLRLMSQGRAAFTMRFDHYAPAPAPLPEDDPPFRPAIGMRG